MRKIPFSKWPGLSVLVLLLLFGTDNSLRFSVATRNGGYTRAKRYSMNTTMDNRRSNIGRLGTRGRTSCKKSIRADSFQDVEGQAFVLESGGGPADDGSRKSAWASARVPRNQGYIKSEPCYPEWTW